MPRGFHYIPGAINPNTGKGIPWMTKRFGEGQFRGGVNARLLGFNAVKRNLTIEIAKLQGQVTLNGLQLAAEYLYKSMLTTSPTIPKDTGYLRGSWYTRKLFVSGDNITQVSTNGKGQPAVEAGFKATYALYVHEMTDAAYNKKINWTEPGSGAKFFQIALAREMKEMLFIIQQNVRIKN